MMSIMVLLFANSCMEEGEPFFLSLADTEIEGVNFTGLPIIFINTKDNTPIISKDSYVDGTFKLDGAGIYSDISATDLTIKGRGNSTWSMPKKPYKLKFKDKISLFNLTEAKDWVLLANYQDPTFLLMR